MSRYLLIDVGAGTMDVLWYDDDADLHYKAVVSSPVVQVARDIEAIPGDLIVTGVEMGGGPVTQLLKMRSQRADVTITTSAAATLSHDIHNITDWGLTVVPDQAVEKILPDDPRTVVCLGDLDISRLENIVRGFGVPFSFDAVGVCAQDHGRPPRGVSHLDFRHGRFVEFLDKVPFPHALLYEKSEVPEEMNRLRSLALQAVNLPTREVFVMDSGMAAILGASMDVAARGKRCLAVLDLATSHTVGAVLADNELAGFFEYHTRDITRERLEALIRDLADGNLRHEQILAEGGHGCYLRSAVGFDNLEAIIATGPRRGIINGSGLPIRYGAPMGDNMMTGTAGLLEAIKRRCYVDAKNRLFAAHSEDRSGNTHFHRPGFA